MRFFHQNYNGKTTVFRSQKLLYEPHMHNAVEIIVMFSGSCKVMVEGAEYTLSSGDFLFVSPNQIHSYTSETETNAGVFIFDTQNFPELKNIIKNKSPESPLISGDTSLCKLAEEILKNYELSSHIVKKGYILLFAGRLLELCRLIDSKEKCDDILNRVFAFCRNNYHLKLSLKDVAEELHISTSYLSHIFSVKMKINFCDYLNMLRINEAVVLLKETDKSITEIADMSGFNSIRTFNRAFAEHLGTTPREYRKL